VVARAEGDARRFNQLVTEYQKAPEVTRDRLYYDTMQAVLLGSSKVLVDGKTGSNINMLPLDKLIGRAPTATGEPTAASSVDVTPASRESAEHNRPDSRSRGQR
jgi:membrane protease subunit HflK